MDSDKALTALLQSSRRIAVVGIKADESADAHRIPRYLQQAGYEILPVNPKLDHVLGARCVATLAEVIEKRAYEAPEFQKRSAVT